MRFLIFLGFRFLRWLLFLENKKSMETEMKLLNNPICTNSPNLINFSKNSKKSQIAPLAKPGPNPARHLHSNLNHVQKKGVTK